MQIANAFCHPRISCLELENELAYLKRPNAVIYGSAKFNYTGPGSPNKIAKVITDGVINGVKFRLI